MENANCSFDDASKTLTFVFRGRLNGDVCAANDQEIENAIDLALRDNPPEAVTIVFDIKHVDYVSSLFLRAVITAAKRAANGKFKLAGANPFIRKMMETSGLNRLIFEA